MKVRVHKNQRKAHATQAKNEVFSRQQERTPVSGREEAYDVDLLQDVLTEDTVLESYDPQILPTYPVPYKSELDALLGYPVPQDIQVLYRSDAPTLYDILPEAEGFEYNGLLFLEDRTVSFDTVAHEVLHALQVDQSIEAPEQEDTATEAATATEAEPDFIAASHPAEVEARLLTNALVERRTQDVWDDFLPLEVTEGVHAKEWAADRGDALPPAPQETDEAQRAVQQALAGPDQQPDSGSEAEEPEAIDTPQSAETPLALTEGTELEELEPPELPAAPEPGVSEEDVAAQQEAIAEAEAALEGAEDPKGVVDSYAEAPPTLKAREAGNLDQKVDEKSASEEQSYQEGLPDFHAEMNLQSEEAEAAEVALPEQEELNVEPDGEGDPVEVDLPPAPEAEEYTENDSIVSRIDSWVSSWFGDDRADRVGDNLNNVSTTDPDVNPSPGDPPAVPLEGETDPQRIANQQEETANQSREKRDEAQQAVLDGPGPEQVQPQNLDEAVEMGELNQPDIEAAIEAQGPESYVAYELPAEVDVAFDQDNQQAMEESFVQAKTDVETATDTRDTDRETALSDAEAEAQQLNETADNDQREEVISAREDIQTQRGDSLEAQRDAVQGVEEDMETERQESQQTIDDRVTEDEAQIEGDYDQAEADAQAEIDEGERQAEAEKRQAERDAENESWWDRAVNFVKAAFEALTAAINSIFDLVRSAINGILDAVIAAATVLIRAAAEFVKGAIRLYGEAAKALVNTLLADTFPGIAQVLNDGIDAAVETATSAVDAVADGLIAGVTALVEGLRGALNAVLDAYQAALNTVLAIMSAALTGDWGAVARLAFEAILKVLGLDPEEVYAFIGRAMETIEIILDDPLGFVGNLFNAFIGGVRQFADNILAHLQAGIIGWLTGALGGAITMPERFDLWGILDIIRQVLGFTWDNIRERVVRIIGERAVQVLEFLYGYIETLVTEGWGALWDQIMNDLTALRDMVFDQIKEFVLTRLIMAAVTRLATMFNPVGAILNLVLMAYQFYTFVRDNVTRMFQLVQSFFEALGNIARGILEPAINGVESTLASFLPLAIDLVARLIGLGNVGGRVREIMTNVQERIWGAIDRVIERVMARFRGGSDTEGAESDASADSELGERLPIPAPDGTHHLTIAVAGTDITFMVNSDPMSIEQLVTMWRGRMNGENNPVPADREAQVNQHLNSLSSAEAEGERTVEQLIRDADISASDDAAAVSAQQALVGSLRFLFGVFGTEGVQGDLSALFLDEIDQADEHAQVDFLNALNRHADAVVENGAKKSNWLDAINGEDFYAKPLLASTRMGTQTRTVVVGWMPGYFQQLDQDPNFTHTVTEPDDWNRFHGNRVGMVHGRSEVFGDALTHVQAQVFDKTSDYTYNTSSDFYTKYETSIQRYLEGTPSPHGEYEPIMLSQFEHNGGTTQIYTYNRVIIQKQDGTIEEVDPPVFTITLRNDRVAEILADNLRFKEILFDVRSGQRGRMQSPPDYDSNLLLNRSHLVADEFMGSAFLNSRNVVVTSETYNQRDMRNEERFIADRIINLANSTARALDPSITEALPEDITFSMNISVSYAQSVFDDSIRQQQEQRLGQIYDAHSAILPDQDAFVRQWLRLNMVLESKLNNVLPVLSMQYTVTVFYKDTGAGSIRRNLGADIYLGLNISAVRALFGAAAD